MHTHHLASQTRLVGDVRASLDDDDLAVSHVGIGKGDVLLARLQDGQAIPQHVDALAIEFGFLGAPVNGLEFHFHAQALGRFLGHIDVKSDQLVLLVAEAHGGEIVIQTDHNLGHSHRSGGCFRRLRGSSRFRLAARSEDGGQCQRCKKGTFFHGFKLRWKNWSGLPERNTGHVMHITTGRSPTWAWHAGKP